MYPLFTVAKQNYPQSFHKRSTDIGNENFIQTNVDSINQIKQLINTVSVSLDYETCE